MSKIFKKLKGFWNTIVFGLLSLVFVNEAGSSYAVPDYGVSRPTPTLVKLLPFIAGLFLIFVIAPAVGLICYRKRGEIKKWPSVNVWILVALLINIFFLAAIFYYLRTGYGWF